MSGNEQNQPGTIAWIDQTVPNADEISEFYQEVVGWRPEQVDMGGYHDFNMLPHDGETPTAGICFSRGANEGPSPQWLVYIITKDVDAAAERCRKLGGQVISRPRQMGNGRFCVIEDTAGAVAALYSP